MASSGNFMTFMPSLASVTLANGNTKATGDGGNFDNPYCSFAFDAEDTEGFYWEWRVGSSDGSTAYGISKAEVNDYTNTSNPTYGFYFDSDAGYAMQGDGNKRNGSTNASYGGSSTSGNKVIGIAVRSGKIYFSIDGTFQNSGDPVNQTGEAFSGITGFWTPTFALNGTHNGILNAGQDSTFSGNETATSNSDANGFGEFHTAPPTGFKALCSGNVTTSSDIDPAQTNDDYPAKQFGVVTYTGTGSSNALTGLGFQPDLVWIKERGATGDHKLTDSSRGVTKSLESNEDTAEATDTNGLTAFGSDGFTVGSDAAYNNSSDTYVAWAWKAGGGSTSSNGNGSITSTVQANTKAGFSIGTYTGTGSNATIGHGLSAKPDFILIKRRNSSQTWGVYHSALGATKYIALNSYAASGTDSAFWNDTEPTTSVISLGTEGRVNSTSQTYVCYAWHNVAGMQKFGSYEGNGNADGPFVYTGFRPRMLIVKDIDRGENWVMFDSERNTYNPVDKGIYPNDGAAETTGSGSGFDVDFLATGFKLRCTHDNMNGSSTYIYACWGDVPFRYNNTF